MERTRVITMTASWHTSRTPPATIGATSWRAVHRATAARRVCPGRTSCGELLWQSNRVSAPGTGPVHRRHNTDEGRNQ